MRITLFFMILCFCHLAFYGQQSNLDGKKADICELVGIKLVSAGDQFNEIHGNNSRLLIIGGSAKAEKGIYNEKRIKDAIKYLNLLFKFDEERIVYGIGKKSTNYGYLELYVEGKLVTKIYFEKNSKLCFGMDETLSINIEENKKL